MPAFRRSLPLLTLLALGCLVAGAGASEFRESEDFADAVAAVDSYAAQYGAENVWLVLDIDNTLLAMQSDLGSDQWFEWQDYLVHNEPGSPELVAEDFAGLLEAQGLLFTLGKMRPPQANLPALLKKTQDDGVATFVITSRGEAFRAATERELAAAGYNIAGHAPEMSKAPQGEFLPYELSCIESYGIRADEATAFGLEEAKPVSLEEGIMMTAGQHKGAMLLAALKLADHRPKAIVYVDDHARHVHRVYDALARRDIECVAMLYKAEEKNVARFRYGDKSEVTAKWRRLQSALKEVFTLPGAAAPAEKTLQTPAHATADAAPARAASH